MIGMTERGDAARDLSWVNKMHTNVPTDAFTAIGGSHV